MSCPQACMTGKLSPCSFFITFRLANSSPVTSDMGRASISVRSINTGPSPFLNTPTTPNPATPVVVSNPSSLSSEAILAEVSRSIPESSGFWCSHLYNSSDFSSEFNTSPLILPCRSSLSGCEFAVRKYPEKTKTIINRRTTSSADHHFKFNLYDIFSFSQIKIPSSLHISHCPCLMPFR